MFSEFVVEDQAELAESPRQHISADDAQRYSTWIPRTVNRTH